jgi:hypothetical protein
VAVVRHFDSAQRAQFILSFVEGLSANGFLHQVVSRLSPKPDRARNRDAQSNGELAARIAALEEVAHPSWASGDRARSILAGVLERLLGRFPELDLDIGRRRPGRTYRVPQFNFSAAKPVAPPAHFPVFLQLDTRRISRRAVFVD